MNIIWIINDIIIADDDIDYINHTEIPIMIAGMIPTILHGPGEPSREEADRKH